MIQGNKAIFVVSNPHIIHYKIIVKKWIKREKNYFKYAPLFDYLYNEKRLEILRSSNFTSFRNPKLHKLFSITILNDIEFYIWLFINKLLFKKIKIYKNIDEIDFKNRVIIDFAYTWGLGSSKHLRALHSFKGIVLIHMTHYFKNSNLIFNSIPNFKNPVLISEGRVTENQFFKDNLNILIKEVTVPFTIDHLVNNIPTENRHKKRDGKCLIMGLQYAHNNSNITELYGSEFLNPDRANFRKLAMGNNNFTFEPSSQMAMRHDFKKTLEELYTEASLFFTGSEVIGLPSINAFEGIYFGAVYIGPRDSTHEYLKFIDGFNYLAYEPGNFTDFVRIVETALSSPDTVTKISKQGKAFIIDNFSSRRVYSNFLNTIDNLVQDLNSKK